MHNKDNPGLIEHSPSGQHDQTTDVTDIADDSVKNFSIKSPDHEIKKRFSIETDSAQPEVMSQYGIVDGAAHDSIINDTTLTSVVPMSSSHVVEEEESSADVSLTVKEEDIAIFLNSIESGKKSVTKFTEIKPQTGDTTGNMFHESSKLPGDVSACQTVEDIKETSSPRESNTVTLRCNTDPMKIDYISNYNSNTEEKEVETMDNSDWKARNIDERLENRSKSEISDCSIIDKHNIDGSSLAEDSNSSYITDSSNAENSNSTNTIVDDMDVNDGSVVSTDENEVDDGMDEEDATSGNPDSGSSEDLDYITSDDCEDSCSGNDDPDDCSSYSTADSDVSLDEDDSDNSEASTADNADGENRYACYHNNNTPARRVVISNTFMVYFTLALCVIYIFSCQKYFGTNKQKLKIIYKAFKLIYTLNICAFKKINANLNKQTKQTRFSLLNLI